MFCDLFHCRKPRTPVNADMYLLGNPKGGQLTPEEGALFVWCGIHLSTDPSVLYYPHILLVNSNRVVTATSECRSRKRNDSCILYSDDGQQSKYALLLKIIVTNQSNTFVVLKTMISAPVQLCHDPVTKAKLQHILAFEHPRLVIHYLYYRTARNFRGIKYLWFLWIIMRYGLNIG